MIYAVGILVMFQLCNKKNVKKSEPPAGITFPEDDPKKKSDPNR